MSAPALLLQSVLDPTQTIVGNGVPGQVYVTLNPNGYQWQIVTQDLPGLVRTGTFPNTLNPNAILQQNLVFNWPYRGGQNQAASFITGRARTTTPAITISGLPLRSPATGVQVQGQRQTLWSINAEVAGVSGLDQYGGYTDSQGRYSYTTARLISRNAWADVPGIDGEYTWPDGHSRILAWAADGYPIYGPSAYADPTDVTSPVVNMTSGYRAQIRANRPAAPMLTVRGTYTLDTEIQVTNPGAAAPGLRVLDPNLLTEVRVLSVEGNTLVLDSPITVTNGTRLQGVWPLGIFLEDWQYDNSVNARLDRYNGRFCVTPEFPGGTYAYFLTVDEVGEPAFPYAIGDVFYGDLQPTPPPPPPPLTWITEESNLGTLAYNRFFSIPLEAEAPGQVVQYQVIAGVTPDGVQISTAGVVSGVPSITTVGSIGTDLEYTFVVRAYTTRIVIDPGTGQATSVVDQFRDKTFSITIAGRELPEFITPAGSLGEFYDGGPILPIQLLFTDVLDNVFLRVAGGQLPPGLTLSPEGVISGYIIPAALVDEPAGYALTPLSEYGYDFLTRASNFNYQFTLEVTDGRSGNLRTFEMYVISRDTLTADTTAWTADTTQITADESSDRLPFLTNPEGSIGRVTDDNFFAYKFDALDLDGQQVRYVLITEAGTDYNWSIPQGLRLDPNTGWLYGYLPPQGLSEQTYTIALRVGNVNDISVLSRIYFYTLTVISGIDTRIDWITPQFLGELTNGGTSLFQIEATNPSGETLQYRLLGGSDSKLPQGLTLLPSGLIAGTASYATFTLDLGTTTFDVNNNNLNINAPTTFDETYSFVVNAYSPFTQEVIYRVVGVTIQDPGSFYTEVPTVTIAPPTASGIPATIGTVSIDAGKITNVTIDQEGFGYLSPPVITITGGGPFATGGALTAQIEIVSTRFLVSENRRFSMRVRRIYNEPLNTLYIEAMPGLADREFVEGLTQNPNLLPPQFIFRGDDPNFGIEKQIIYAHAFGIKDDTLEAYARALELNHYRKQLTLGELKTATAVGADGVPIYEVIYSEIIDNLVNDQGVSVGKEVTLDYPVVYAGDSTEITTVYPNSLDNMRDQVIDSVGAVSVALPLWMTSIQPDTKTQLGFVPAWVIAYIRPGNARRLLFNIREQFGDTFNRVNFTADRYILGRALSKNWDPVADSTGGAWVPTPSLTTFDLDPHYRPLEPDGSTESFIGGINYTIGSEIFIPGSQLTGLDGVNDLTITVADVDENGSITEFFLRGIAPYLEVGEVIYGASGITRVGTGTGASFDLVIGSPANTRFDGGSMLFVAPVDNYEDTDRYDKYLVFPKRNILQ